MSCKFSKKFEPLVLSWAQDPNMTEEDFYNRLQTYFEDADTVFDIYARKEGQLSSSSFTLWETAKAKLGLGEDAFTSDGLSVKANYTGDFRGYANMIRSFKQAVISASVYDIATGSFVDADKDLNGYTALNRKLFSYKVDLINRILDSLGKSNISIDIDSENAGIRLNEAINTVKKAYESQIRTTKDGWDEYVILSNFNKLVEEQTPFIKVKSSYENTTAHGVDMYYYDGPHAKIRQSWSKEDDIPGAEESYSGLAKILLDLFPEVQKDNETPISNTSIGSAGFASVMSTMRSALLYDSDPRFRSIREEYMKGAQMDMIKVIDAYLEYITHSGDAFNTSHHSFLENKLRGIRKYIYSSNMQDDIRNMFTRMFFETVPISYMSYGMYNGRFSGVTLSERWINNQNYNIQNVLNGRIYNFRAIPRKWAVVKKNHHISIKGNAVSGAINIVPDGTDTQLSIAYLVNNGKINFIANDATTETFADSNALTNLIWDITGYLITPEYTGYSKMIHGDNSNTIEDFIDALGIVILASDNSMISGNPLIDNGAITTVSNQVNFNRMGLYNHIRDISIIEALTKGAEVANTVKDVNGNNLPTRGLSDLAHQFKEQLYQYQQAINNGINSFASQNLIFLNEDVIGEPIVREGVSKDRKGKKARQLTEPELYECEIIYDFFTHLIGDGIIHLQNATFADKGKHYIWGYNLNNRLKLDAFEETSIDLLSLLRRTYSGDNKAAVKELTQLYYDIRSRRYLTIEENILDKFNQVFDTNYTSLIDVDKFLADSNISYETLKQAFFSKNIDFADDFDAVNNKGVARINETLLNMLRTFNGTGDMSRAEKRLERSKRRFVIDLINSGFKLNRYSSKGGQIAYIDILGKKSDWVDTTSGNVILAKAEKDGKFITIGRWNSELLMDPTYKVSLNPMLESYFFADVILSNELNSLMVGETFSHKVKKNNGDPTKMVFDESEYEEFGEAGRLIAQDKRNVIPGASMHVFLQGLQDGVAENIKVAVMSDIPGFVYNMQGKADVVDSSDGSGISCIYEAMLEQNSLIDAATGLNMKTIGWDVDPATGRPMMLKWAVYATTNENRRNGYDSTASYEDLHRKLTSEKIGYVDVSRYFNSKNGSDNFYFFNNETGITYKLENVLRTVIDGNIYFYRKALVTDTDGNPTETIHYLDKNGNAFDPNNIDLNFAENNLKLNNIYDLDIFFGGAYAKAKGDDGGLHFKNLNNKIVLDIICKERLKDKFIAYAVNKSAFKVGYANVNNLDSWTNPNVTLRTINMSTRHIGLQMNAEHELDDSEVTEMTQMISALAENWYTGNIAKEIYKDIGAVVDESLRSIGREIQANDMDALRIRLGKALIDSFKTKEDTIGLAQAFLTKAEEAIRDSDATVNIPFSASTINGAFIATITSMLTKKGIRRKYAGVAAVLNPSYDMIQYYRYADDNGKVITSLHSGVSEVVRNWKSQNPGFSNTRIRDFLTKLYIIDDLGNVHENPFVDNIYNSIELQPEDTIVVWNSENQNWSNPIRLDSWETYNKYVNEFSEINTPMEGEVLIKRLKLAPKNLRGSDTKFKVDGIQYSIYNLDSVRAAHGDAIRMQKLITDPYFAEDIVDDPKQTIQNIVQHQLEDISKGILHDSKFVDEFGNTVTKDVYDVEVIPAEMIMGKLNADKFGLQDGDRLDDIMNQGWKFFYNRWVDKYQLEQGIPNKLYDIIVYTRKGPLLVKIGDYQSPEQFNLTRNRNIEVVDDQLVYADMELCPESGKKRYSYLSNSNKEYNILVVDTVENLNDILESDAVDTYRYNINEDNWITIAKYLDPNGRLYGMPTAEESFIALKDSLRRDFEDRLRKLSIQRFDAFNLSLNVVGARIPTQAMQSFMPMRIIALTDNEIAEMFVPRVQTWLQGSDYDIDKIYTLAYSIADNGTLPTLSSLGKDFRPEEVLRLPIPDGRTFTESQNGIKVTFAELAQVVGINPNETLSNTKQVKLFVPEDLVRTKYDLESFVRILNSGATEITFEKPLIPQVEGLSRGELRAYNEQFYNEQMAIFNRAKKEYLRLLNKHSHSNISKNREAALRNNVVWGAFTATTSPINQINAHSPVDMDEPKAAAELTILNDAEKHVSSDIPSTKFKIQQQAMVGKDVTGISAVSVKVFFATTTYFNEILDSVANLIIQGNNQEAIDVLSNLVMPNPLVQDNEGNFMPALIGNVNIKRIKEKLGNIKMLLGVKGNGLLNRPEWNLPNGFDLEACLNYLQKNSSLTDSALSLSALLSSATDNMKELILPKLNANAQFVDIYTSLISTGIPLKNVATILTSPMFTAASKLSQSNLFREETMGYRTDKALGFFLNEDTLPHVSKSLIKLALENAGYKPTYDTLFDFLSYTNVDNVSSNPEKRNSILRNTLKKLYELRNNKSVSWSEQNYEDYFDGIEDDISDRRTLRDVTIDELNNLINFFEEAIIRNNTIVSINESAETPLYKPYGTAEKQLKNLRLIKDEVIPKTDEQRIFGQMLGINQGMDTDPYKMYSMIRRIENHVNKRIDSFNKSGAGNIEEEFNLLEFLKPENVEYRNRWMDNYDLVKSSYNILRAITAVPHFNRMFDVLYTNDWILSNFSAKYNLVNRLARELERRNPYIAGNKFDRVLNDKEYVEIQKYINDIIITGWLSEQNLKFDVPKDNIIYTTVGQESVRSIKTVAMKNLYDFATFKNWMETYVIPELQTQSPFKDHIFINSLELVAQENRRTGKIDRYYRLPLNMMTIEDSVKTERVYENLLNDFDSISNMTFGGWKLSDLFFVYNLIVNKDGFGHSSMTRLFENLVSAKRGSSFVNSFYEYISNMDKDVANRDAMYNGIANTSTIQDLESRIALNVTKSTISGNTALIKSLPSDFTFWVPQLMKNWTQVRDTVLPFKYEHKSLFNVKVSSSVLRSEIINHIKDLYGENNVISHSQTWFDENFKDDELARTQPAFIHNGKLYIKNDSPNGVTASIHELAHFILAEFRWGNPERKKFYYELMERINPDDFRDSLGDVLEEYQKTRVGVDLKEEIFAKILEKYFVDNMLPKDWKDGVIIQSSSEYILDALNEVFGTRINSEEDLFRAVKSDISDVLQLFSSILFEFNPTDDLFNSSTIINTEKVADLKNKLRNANLLEETECN